VKSSSDDSSINLPVWRDSLDDGFIQVRSYSKDIKEFSNAA
jgi:hypothetical protein